MNRGKGIATIASQLRELGLLSEEFFSSENNDSASSSSKNSKIKEKFDAIDEESRNTEYIFDEILKDQDILALVQFDKSGELFDIINKIFVQSKPSDIANWLKENQVKIKSYINLIGSSSDIDSKVKDFLLELFDIDNLNLFLSQLPDDNNSSIISLILNNTSNSLEVKNTQEKSKEVPQLESPKPNNTSNTPKDNIIKILTRDTKNASTQIFNDEYIPLLANILFDTDRVKIEKYISNLKQKATKEQIQEYIDVITDSDVKKVFVKLQDTKELNNASDILKNNTSASLNLYAILSASDDNNSAEYINIPLVLEKNFQKLRNNLYKHFNNTNRSGLNYWLNFMYLKDFDSEKIVVGIPEALFNEIEVDILNENGDIVVTHPIAMFLNSIRSDFRNGLIGFGYDVETTNNFIKSNGSTQNISGYRNTINNFLRKNDINVSAIPSYYDMSYNGFDNKFGSKANKLKLIIMQNIYSKRIFGLKLYKSDYGFVYAYLNHLIRAQGKRVFVISAKNLGKLYGGDHNPSNISKIKKSEILEKNSDIIVVEDADYFYDRAEKTRDRLKGLGKTVILLGNQSSGFDNPFGSLCQTSMIYDLPASSKKSQKEIFAKIYNNQLSSLFKITLSQNALDVLPIMIGSINRNYGNIKAIFDKVSIDQEKIKEYIGKDMILELGDSYHKSLSTNDIGEIVLFLKIYGHGFELSIDDIDDCMRSFYGKEHVAEGGYSEEMSSLAYNLLTKPYSTDILGIPLSIQNPSDTKKLVKDKYKVDKLDTTSLLQDIITDNSMLLEFVDILNKKIIKKYYNTTGDL